MKVKEESVKAGIKLSKNEDRGIQSHPFIANRWGKSGSSDRFLFSWAPRSLWTMTAAMKLKDTCSLEEKP